MVYGIWYINCNIDEFATNVHKIKNGKMLTNRNCKNIQHGADFAKTFLGQQCCHAVKVFLTLETEEEKGGWYNKVQTEMYKWDPEVCGFELSPKRAENVIQINISTLRKEVGKVNK